METMFLPQKALDDLKAIHRRKTGEVLSDHEAREMGNRLLRVFGILLRPPESQKRPESSNPVPFD